MFPNNLPTCDDQQRSSSKSGRWEKIARQIHCFEFFSVFWILLLFMVFVHSHANLCHCAVKKHFFENISQRCQIYKHAMLFNMLMLHADCILHVENEMIQAKPHHDASRIFASRRKHSAIDALLLFSSATTLSSPRCFILVFSHSVRASGSARVAFCSVGIFVYGREKRFCAGNVHFVRLVFLSFQFSSRTVKSD